jgi:hypothetical protein
MLGSGAFTEPTKVSVSPGYTGKPGEDPNDSQTWPWYRYDNGPYGDTGFATQGYIWDRAHTNWTAQPMDFTKPVNPVFGAQIEQGGLSVADAIDLYTGSGGGTGFDLAASGFPSIRYLKVEGIAPDFSGGEIDAISVVRPMVLGESLAISPQNLTNGVTSLSFQQPGNPAENALTLQFESLNQAAQTAAAAIVNTVQFTASPVLGNSPLTFQTDLTLGVGPGYFGTGGDLTVLQQNSTNWTHPIFTFDPAKKAVIVRNLTNLTAFVVTQMRGPQLTPHLTRGGFEFLFTPISGWTHVLERTVDFSIWTAVDSMTPLNTQTASLHDTNAPAAGAFYRLRLSQQ